MRALGSMSGSQGLVANDAKRGTEEEVARERADQEIRQRSNAKPKRVNRHHDGFKRERETDAPKPMPAAPQQAIGDTETQAVDDVIKRACDPSGPCGGAGAHDQPPEKGEGFKRVVMQVRGPHKRHPAEVIHSRRKRARDESDLELALQNATVAGWKLLPLVQQRGHEEGKRQTQQEAERRMKRERDK